MEVIKTYINNVFSAYPQTSEIQALRQDMLANMEEKYTVLRQNGKSEHEAAYSVIANFGSIEEITSELGLDINNNEQDYALSLQWDEVQTYLAKSKKSGILVGLGVWIIIAGVASFLFLNNLFVMFVAIAIAVAIFIVNGSTMGEYESYEEQSLRLDSHTREMVESRRAKFMSRYTAMIAAGVALIILAAGAFITINFSLSLFLTIIGFSVFLFIVAGSYSSAFDILLDKGEYSNKEAQKQADRIMGVAAVIYWPVATAIYLLWSFAGNAWHISWLVWPVAGVLFGAICGGVSVWFGMKGKKNGNS